MRTIPCLAALCAVALAPPVRAQTIDALAPAVRKLVKVATRRVVLEHVLVLDGTGGPPLPDRNVVLESGRIAAIAPGADEPPRDGTTVLDLRGHAVAIRIATLNGATYLGRQDRIGSIAAGKNADLVVVKGDPSARIAGIENVELVFKDGVGYDPARRYGQY